MLVLNTGGHTDKVSGLFFTRDGKQLLSVGQDRTLRVWDLALGELVRVLRLPISEENPIGSEGVVASSIGVSNFFTELNDSPSLLRILEAAFPRASRMWFLSLA